MVGGPEATLASRAAAPSEPGTPARTGEVLTLEDVAVRFGGISAVSGVSLSVPEGIVLGLIGPNGAGKTTLFDVISGIRTPNAGKVWFRGRDATRASAVARSRQGGPRPLPPGPTLWW